MDYHISVTHVASLTTAVVRRQAALHELATVIPQACGEVWAFIRSSHLPNPGRNLVLYLDAEWHLECGVEVATPFAGNGHVFCSSTPAGLVATAVHRGPYDRLGDAHTAIRQWCSEHGYTLSGMCWEVYGHWHDNPSKLRTDVFYPVKAKVGDERGEGQSPHMRG